MKLFPRTIFFAAAICAAFAGCASNEFTRTGTRAPSSAAEQMCGGPASNVAQHNFCLQEMQGEDRHG